MTHEIDVSQIPTTRTPICRRDRPAYPPHLSLWDHPDLESIGEWAAEDGERVETFRCPHCGYVWTT